MELKQNKLGTMPIGRLLVSVSAPLMVSMLVQSLYNIVDSIYVAQLSENALTATSLANPMQFLMIAFATGTGVGVNSLVSRSLGEKNRKVANSAAMHGYLFGLFNTLLFVLFGQFLCRPFFTMFTDDPVIAGLGVDYLTICCTYSIGVFLAVISERLLQGTGKSMLSMISQLSGAIVNIVLDPILIFGRYGMPEMGIKGAAAATVIGQCCALVVSTTLNCVYNKELHLTLRGFRFSGEITRRIYVVAFPSIVMQGIGTLANLLLNGILIVYSSTAVAVLGVYYKLQSFVFMPVFGLTQGLIPIVGYNYGARKKKRIGRAVGLGLVTAGSILLVGTVIFQFAAPDLMGMFKASGELLSLGTAALRSISYGFIFAAVSIILGSMSQGLGVGYPTLITSLSRQMIVLVPCAYFLAKYAGLHAVWLAFPIGEVISTTICVILSVHIYRTRVKTLPDDPDEDDQPAFPSETPMNIMKSEENE